MNKEFVTLSQARELIADVTKELLDVVDGVERNLLAQANPEAAAAITLRIARLRETIDKKALAAIESIRSRAIKSI